MVRIGLVIFIFSLFFEVPTAIAIKPPPDFACAPKMTMKLNRKKRRFTCVDANNIRRGREVTLNRRGDVIIEVAYKQGDKIKETFFGTKESGRKKVIRYFPGGKQKKSVVSFKESKKDGIEITYFDNGQMKSEINFIDGTQSGNAKYWDQSGQITRQAVFDKGKIKDETKFSYSKEGELKQKIDIVEGKQEAIKEFDDKGEEIKPIECPSDTSFESQCCFFYYCVSTKTSKRQGPFKRTTKKGDVLAEGNYHRGKKVGTESIYDRGEKVRDHFYSQGKKTKSLSYYGPRQLSQEQLFENGRLVSEKNWDREGALISKKFIQEDGTLGTTIYQRNANSLKFKNLRPKETSSCEGPNRDLESFQKKFAMNRKKKKKFAATLADSFGKSLGRHHFQPLSYQIPRLNHPRNIRTILKSLPRERLKVHHGLSADLTGDGKCESIVFLTWGNYNLMVSLEHSFYLSTARLLEFFSPWQNGIFFQAEQEKPKRTFYLSIEKGYGEVVLILVGDRSAHTSLWLFAPHQSIRTQFLHHFVLFKEEYFPQKNKIRAQMTVRRDRSSPFPRLTLTHESEFMQKIRCPNCSADILSKLYNETVTAKVDCQWPQPELKFDCKSRRNQVSNFARKY